MTHYSWTVIGAGPAGIAAVGRLLDHGIVGEQIAWIDPEFGAGDFGTKWRAVPSNTHVELFLDYFTASPSFRFGQAPAFELNNFDPEQTCPLGIVAEPLVWISQHLCQRVRAFRVIATELALANRQWTITTQHETITSKNVILAVGSVPKKLSYVELDEIPIETALDPAKLAQLPLDGATVAVFWLFTLDDDRAAEPVEHPGEQSDQLLSQSAEVRCLNLTIGRCSTIPGLRAKPPTGGARTSMEPTRDGLERCSVGDPEFEKTLQMCDHIVYTVGFERRHLPLTPQWGSLEYDPTNGILAPGLFGVGIAFPEY